MSIFVRTVPNVMQQYGCTADYAQRFIDLRQEGYSTQEAALMAGIADPPEPPEPPTRNDLIQADLMERAACLRAAIRNATESLEGKHQDGKLAIQIRAHLAELQKMERELLAAD